MSNSFYNDLFFYVGEVPEWLKGHDWKSCILLKRVSRVRIPSSPFLSRLIMLQWLLALSPLLLGVSSYFFPFFFFPSFFYESFFMEWALKGTLFFTGIGLILGKNFLVQHTITYKNYSLNTLYIWIFLYGIIGCPLLLLEGAFSLFATSCILSPILEEFVARGFLTILPPMSEWRVIALIMINAAAFSLMHWFWQDGMIGIITWQQHVNQFIGHFVFGTLLAIIVYKYKRIDGAILLHCLSNFGYFIGTL